MAAALCPLCWGQSSGVLCCEHLRSRLSQQLCSSNVLPFCSHVEGGLLQTVCDPVALLWGSLQEDLQRTDVHAPRSYVQRCVPLLVLHLGDKVMGMTVVRFRFLSGTTEGLMTFHDCSCHQTLEVLKGYCYLYVMDWFADKSKEGRVSLFRCCLNSSFLCFCSSQQQSDQVCMATCSCPVQS